MVHSFAPDSKITDIVKKQSFTLSAEVIPPRNGGGPGPILEQINSLTANGAQFLAVTKGAGGSLRGGSLPIAQLIKDRFKRPCIAHFTCRDLVPEEVENQLIDHHLFGIRNILALRGDPPLNADGWKAREESYPYAYMLIEQIRNLNQGIYLERDGFKVEAREKTDFCIGAAAYPDSTDPKERIDYFKMKIDAGASYGITQMLFCADSYARYLDDLAKLGITVPIFPGTRILKSKKQAERMASRFQVPVPEHLSKRLPDDDTKATPDQIIEPFLDFVADLRRKGAPGAHLFVLSDTELASRALQSLAR